MDRKLVFFMFLIGLFVASLFVGGETKSASIEKNDFSVLSDGNSLSIHYFYGSGCPHCARVEPFLEEMQHKYPIQLRKYDIYSNRSCIPLFDNYSSRYGIPLGERGVPTIFVSDTYFIGDSPILDGFEEVVKNALKEGSLPDQDLKMKALESSDQKDVSMISNLPVLSLTVAALVDAISPCSIAILVFLIGARVLGPNRRERALKVGLSFCLSVFIAYFLFGLGLFTVVQISGFSGTFSLLVGLIAVLAGIFYLKDVFWYGSGEFVMEVPRSLKPSLMKMLKRVTSPLGAFAIGFVVVLFELPCTGGPYLFILGQIADSATRLQAVPFLLYYDFIFVLPLIIISLLLYSNFFSVARIREWSENNKRLLRLVGGFTMMALGFLAIPISPMIQLLQLFLRCFKIVAPPILVIMSLYLVVSFAKAKNLGSRLTQFPKGAILLLSLLVTTVFVVQTPIMRAFENIPPVANAGPDQTVLMGELVAFDGGGSYDPDGTIISYEWDFRDPSDSTLGTGVNPTHTYSLSDVYVVILTVMDDAGDERSDTMTVVVEDKIVMLELNYDSVSGSFSLLDVYKKSGFAPDRRVQPESGYKAQVISETEKILYTFTFAVPNILQYDYPASGDILAGGSIEVNETDFTLIIPYFEGAAQIDIYYPDDTLALSVNVENIPEKGGSNCQTMVNNGLSSRLFDIVFVADGYTTAQLTQFATEVGRHNRTLLSVPPFSNHSSNINIHWVNESRNLGCYYGAGGISRLIQCNNTAVLNLASQCPADEIVVIVANNTYGGMGQLSAGDVTTYAVSYNGTDPLYGANWSGDRVTVHELGHSFGNLHDEYIYTTPLPGSPTGPNCDANPSCTKWSAWNKGCYAGCSNLNWYRGDNAAGDLMMTLVNLSFGPVCRRALNASLSNYPRRTCGGSTPCQCGDLLTQSRTLNSSDFSTGACGGDGLEIGGSGITLDCNGTTIIGSGSSGSTGIKNTWFNNVTIKNCNVSKFNNGIHIRLASNNVITNNTVSSSAFVLGGSGIWIETSTNNNVTNNTVSSYQWGIALDILSNSNLAEANNVFSCQCGIELYSSSGNTLKHNTANRNTWHGIHLNTGSTNNIILNNTADLNSRNGLYISDSGSTSNTVNNNTLCANNQLPQPGYADILDADSNSGDNNTCNFWSNWNDIGTTGCTYRCPIIPYDDMYITQNTTLTPGIYNIVDNQVTGQKGVILMNTNNVFLDCNGATINGPGTGIGIKIFNVNNVVVKNCRITGYSEGVRLTNANSSIITNNTIASDLQGITYVDYPSHSNLITNNTISNNSLHGIAVGGFSNSNNITNNVINDNNRFGIFLGGTNNTFVDSNTICYNLQDLNLSSYSLANFGGNNTCNIPDGWNDTGTTGCTHCCPARTLTFSNTSLGVNLSVRSSARISINIANTTDPNFAIGGTNGTIGMFANITADASFDWIYIEIYYNETVLTVNESTLRMYYWNSTLGNWTAIPNSGVNTTANYVWANVTHLTVFTGIGRPIILGDLNGDSRCNYQDLYILAVNYGKPVPPGDPRADINGDGRVNYKDLYILATNYGKSWP